MKRIIASSFLAMCFVFLLGCDLWIAGSKKTEYRIEIETHQIGYSDLQQIEAKLKVV